MAIPIEQKVQFLKGAKAWNHAISHWLTDVEQGCHDCIQSPNAMEKQKRIAQQILDNCQVLRRDDTPTDGRSYYSYIVGKHCERMNLVILEEPSKIGALKGYMWHGHWLEATDLERCILHTLHDTDEMDLHNYVRAVWSMAYRPDDRSRVDKAHSKLNGRLAALGYEIRIRGNAVIVDTHP